MRFALLALALLGALAVVLGLVLARGGDQPEFRGSRPPDGLLMPEAAYSVAPELRGSVAAVTFLDTQCTEACPVVAAQIGQAMRLLDGEPVRAVAFSVDPENDTPARIRAFLAKFRAAGALQFVRGTERSLRPVWSGFQIQPSVDTGNSNLHSVPVRVYDATGEWRSTLHPGVDLTPANLANDLRAALETG